MTFFDLVKALASGPKTQKFITKVEVAPGKYRYTYAKTTGSKRGGGKGSAPKPPVDSKLDRHNFNGTPVDAATLASLGQMVAISSDRKVMRDRYGAKWAIVNGHLVRVT